MSAMYFIVEDGVRKGPLTLEQIAHLPIGPHTLIEREGAGFAQPAVHVPELWHVLGARRAAGEALDGGPPLDPRIEAIRERLAAPSVVCPVIIAANVLVFIAMVATGANWLNPHGTIMLRWGADFWPATTSGQWWRLLTAAFLHFGAIHLAANMYALWSIGRFAERIFGSVAFAALYLLTALISSLVSVWWDPDAITAGASGAVFAVFGAVLSYLLIRKASFPRHALKSLIQGTVVVIGFNVFWGLTQPGISNSAHLGGLASGMILGAIFASPMERERRQKQWVPRLLTGVVVGVAALAAGIVLIPKAGKGSFQLRAELSFAQARQSVAQVENQVIEQYNRLVRQAKDKKWDDAEFGKRLEGDVVPLWGQALKDLKAAEVSRGSVSRPLWEGLVAYVRQRQEAYAAFAEGLQAGDEAALKRHEELMRKADRTLAGLKAASERAFPTR
jgi:rhomboid protease GluP